MTEPKDSRQLIITNVTDPLHCSGINLKALQAQRCLISVCPDITVVRMRQAGSLVRIQQWPMGLSTGKCVFTGPLAAVSGPETSLFETVAVSMCTSCQKHPDAVCGTVVTIKVKGQLRLRQNFVK